MRQLNRTFNKSSDTRVQYASGLHDFTDQIIVDLRAENVDLIRIVSKEIGQADAGTFLELKVANQRLDIFKLFLDVYKVGVH